MRLALAHADPGSSTLTTSASVCFLPLRSSTNDASSSQSTVVATRRGIHFRSRAPFARVARLPRHSDYLHYSRRRTFAMALHRYPPSQLPADPMWKRSPDVNSNHRVCFAHRTAPYSPTDDPPLCEDTTQDSSEGFQLQPPCKFSDDTSS